MLTAQRSNADLQQMQKDQRNIATDVEKWKAVVERDETMDGLFVFAVRSTGIYCKPSCPARHPNLEQVIFFSQPDAAERSGFRACKRCQPQGARPSARAQLIQKTCRYIETNLDERLTLESLSRQAGLSPFHFQRTFKRILGISPRQSVEAALKEDYYAADLQRDDEGMKKWTEALLSYFNGREFPRDLPLDVQATAFQWRVWKEIQSIPYGQTETYSDIAASLGTPQATRAVARACATNPVAIVIPCHRVIGKDGSLRGYAWGVKRKKTLLSLETKVQRNLTNE